MKNTRKGFTLVELLIVIVVIGILSAMMMLSSTEAVTSAKSSNIVSNLRNLKTAALALYTDSMDHFNTKTKNSANPKLKDVMKYLSAGTTIPDSRDYDITCVGNAPYASWFLKYTIKGTNNEMDQIKRKLKGRAGSTGLLKEAKVTDGVVDTASYDGGNDVYIHVR